MSDLVEIKNSITNLKQQDDPNQRQITLTKLYDRVYDSWKYLTDIRFKLLGLIPVISGAVLFNLLSSKQDGPSPVARIGIAFFGLIITTALRIYDQRNTQLYIELVHLGKDIEEELGIVPGVFSGRSAPKGIINHRTAINIIYGAAIVAWLIAIYFIILGM